MTDEEIVKALEHENAQLKAENKRLKDEFKTDYRNSWKNKFFSALEEIERLKGFIDKQKAEIERLTEELATAKQELVNEQRYYENAYSKACQLETQNTKLQKQVDELKASDMSEMIDLFNTETDRLIEKAHQQAVKDTAKDIANWLPTTVNEDKNVLSRIIKEHYGVEVE